MEISISLEPDNLDPSQEDWSKVDDASVWLAAKDGIPQAIEEAERRNA